MSPEVLYDAITEVKDALVIEAMETKPAKKIGIWLKWGAMAACLCIVIAGGLIWHQSTSSHSESPGITVSEDGVKIPQMEVSLSANEAADMIAFFIYQGRCYVQYEQIYSDVDIIGEYLGTATGLIDEWTPREGYVELAGSVNGDFYAVKGYDPAFMLCMRDPTGSISTYICNNGITLKYGSELYEDRLHLYNNIESVEYESRVSWYFSRGERYQMNSINDVVLELIAGMDSAQFVPSDSVPLGEGRTHIAETELYHMYFQMKDGTTVHLRLHENGYVRFDGIWSLCVHVPEENYVALLELLDSHADSTAIYVEPTRPTFEDCKNDAELGEYVPAYAPEDIYFAYASIYYYLDRQTVDEIGTKEIWLNYESLEKPRYFYTLIITWSDEYGKSGWAGPMIDVADLDVESISEYIRTETIGEESFLTLDMGVWYDDAFIVISAYGIDAETAYKIFNSVPHIPNRDTESATQ